MIVKNGKIVNFSSNELERFVVSMGWYNLEIWDFPEVIQAMDRGGALKSGDYEVTIIDEDKDVLNQLGIKLSYGEQESTIHFYKKYKNYFDNCAVVDGHICFIERKIICSYARFLDSNIDSFLAILESYDKDDDNK